MSIDLSRFRDTFLEEAAEHVATIEQHLLALEESDAPRELLDAIFRAAHSIKGGSGAFGFSDIAHFTHALESVLDRLREGQRPHDRSTIDLLLAANDVLKGLLDAARTGGSAPAEMAHVQACLTALLDAPATPVASAPEMAVTDAAADATSARMSIVFRPSSDILRQGLDPLVLLRELSEMGTVESSTVDASRLLAAAIDADAADETGPFNPETCYLAWTLVLQTSATARALRDVFLFAEDDADITIEPVDAAPRTSDTRADVPPGATGAAPAAAGVADAPIERRAGADRRKTTDGASLRVATEKVDRLIDLVGEIVIAQSMVSTLAEHFTPARLGQLRDAVASLERNTRELQERVMAIRMVPVGGVFSRFPRLVRDIAAGLGKDVRVDMVGGETEIDKGIVERIGDPLTHLVRNAVDHGLETPEERERAGKPRHGTITLAAYTRGGMVTIEVTDDGRGLDEGRIRAKAIERGLIAADQTLTTDALHQLIFHPGFSTAAEVSDLSGRGVGMDVVKRNIEELNGSVTVESQRHIGTRVRLALPLTLAILEGQSLTVGATTYVLPLTAIIESLRPRPVDVCTVLGSGEVIRVRGDAIPLVRLHRYLGVQTDRTDPTQGIVVLVEHQGRRAALLADELLGQHQVVIKGLDTNYRRVEGVMGATIMGDGSVALILDVPGLLRLAQPGLRPDSVAAA